MFLLQVRYKAEDESDWKIINPVVEGNDVGELYTIDAKLNDLDTTKNYLAYSVACNSKGCSPQSPNFSFAPSKQN